MHEDCAAHPELAALCATCRTLHTDCHEHPELAAACEACRGPRPISEIALDVSLHWEDPHPSARPYLDAMGTLKTIRDSYGHDSAASVLAYFLANAKTWKGPDARRVKAEIRALLKGVNR